MCQLNSAKKIKADAGVRGQPKVDQGTEWIYQFLW